MNIIEKNIDRLKSLCEKHEVAELYVFGSVLNNHFSSESDIDFIVTFDEIELEKYADNYFDIHTAIVEIDGYFEGEQQIFERHFSL